MFDNEVELDDNVELYFNSKVLNYLFYKNYLHVLTTYSYYSLPLSYTQVMNMFTPNFDESANSADRFDSDSLLNSDSVDLNKDFELRYYNSLKLREPSKNSIKLLFAFKKVFNIRFTENRSNTTNSDLTINSSHYPLISGQTTDYGNLLGKNKENYFDSIFYKNLITHMSPLYGSLFSSSNIYYTNIPFIIGMRSDPIKYI
jgi:hypothetical protein